MAGEGEEALAAFVALHGAALRASRVPTQYWESLSRKLRGEVQCDSLAQREGGREETQNYLCIHTDKVLLPDPPVIC